MDWNSCVRIMPCNLNHSVLVSGWRHFRDPGLLGMGLVPTENVTICPICPSLSFLPLSLCISPSLSLFPSLSSLSSPSLCSYFFPSPLYCVRSQKIRQPSAHWAVVLTRQQISSCTVLSLLLWLNDGRRGEMLYLWCGRIASPVREVLAAILFSPFINSGTTDSGMCHPYLEWAFPA